MNSVISSLTQLYLVLRMNSTICYHPRALADTILETSAVLRRQKCALIVTRTHLLQPCSIGRTFIRSFFQYSHFILHEIVILIIVDITLNCCNF